MLTTARWPSSREQDWCLFVDRDGVINKRVEGDYVRDWQNFRFLPGATEALTRLSRWAPYTVIVTNQQGVGRGLMSSDALLRIHEHVTSAVRDAGGHIDAVLSCVHLAADACGCRKPEIGLARDWLARRPHVNAARSVVVGDSATDLQMGRTLGALTCVWIKGEAADLETPEPSLYDASFPSLQHFSAYVDDAVRQQEAP